jgi:peptidoglycan/LPS O-acetylase OafA/YrhL
MTMPSASAAPHAHGDKQSTTYRPDIDGLRAIAVLSVLFFHAGLPPFTGGFVGVDIFFVISGYLITGIILADIGKARFSIANFYERRIRRIFPALYLTIALTIAGALALFTAVDLERFFESLAWLAVFASNFYFADNSGYFDAAADQNAILQTWSLAIEEQFYVFFPLLLALLHKQRRVDVKWVILALALLSLAVSIYLVDRDARPAFFSTFGRVWELMVGALAAVGLYPKLRSAIGRTIASSIGLLAIAGSLVLLTIDTPFPGAYALPACLGTVAIIWAGACGETPVNRWLSWRPLVFVGLISYSLYLLHWPILVFAKYWNQGELSIAQTAAALTLAVALAWLSWRFIETPFRKPAAPLPRRRLFAGAISLMLALAVVGLASAQWQRGNFNAAEKFIEAQKARALAEPCMVRDTQTFAEWPAAQCRQSGSGPAIAVWGDSFAAHYFDAFRQVARESDRPITLLAESSCPPIDGLAVPNRPGCASFNKGALALLQAERPPLVILSADWIVYEKKKTAAEMFEDKFELLTATIAKMRASGSRVLVIGPSPEFTAPVAQIASNDKAGAKESSSKARFSRKFDLYFRDLARQGAIDYFPVYPLFCTASQHCRYRQHGDLLFWDTGHLTERGGDYVIRELIKTPAFNLDGAPKDRSPARN